MIIITGPGRSGTSFIAQVYQGLGFDVGGEWVAEIHGGLEAPEIVQANEEIIEALGLTPMGAPGGNRRIVRQAGGLLVPARYRSALRDQLKWLPWMRSRQPGFLRWDRLSHVSARMAPRLRDLSLRYPLAKDPRFLWTLPAWIAAGVDIEHVLVAVRNLDAVVESRGRMDSLRFRSTSAAKNSIVYGLGLTQASLLDARISYALVRFPDFVDEPSSLFRAARFPAVVTEDQFAEVVGRLRRPELVHDRR